MAIGMSYKEFWFENPYIAETYLKAHKIREEMKKYDFWTLGAYFYESLANTSVMFRDFAKNGSKPKPYPGKPYGVEERKKTAEELEEEAENERLRARIHFDILFKNMSKRFNKAGENEK